MSDRKVGGLDSSQIQSIARDFVHENVQQSASSLVYELSQKSEVVAALDIESELMDLMAAKPNYQEAAEEEGWRYDEEKDEFFKGEPDYPNAALAAGWGYDQTAKVFVDSETDKKSEILPGDYPSLDAAWKKLCEEQGIEPEYEDSFVSTHSDEDDQWQDLCNRHDIEPHQNEIYEHWIVTDFFARKMEEQGYGTKGELFGLTIWGRPCTGQAIFMDEAVQAAALRAKGLLQDNDLEEEEEQEQGQSR